MGAEEFGLRAAGELPSEAVYRAHLLADAVALRPADEGGEMTRAVELDAVMPFSPLMTPQEVADWAADEAVRHAAGGRNGVQLGSDRRDWGSKILNPPGPRPDAVEAPLQGMGARPSAKERAAAEAALRDHSRRISPDNKRED